MQSVGLSHSKSVKIVSQKFEKQSYFSDRRLAKYDIQLLFKLRTRMTECKSNFEGQFNDMTCRVCNVEGTVENEDHILQCSVLKTEDHNVSFGDVYGSSDQQFQAIKVFKKMLRKQKVYLDANIPSS